MANKTALAPDYFNLQKEYNKNAQGISEWERRFLQPLQQEFSQATEAVQKRASYDISGAYANYKQNQLNIMQNQQLAKGFKEKIASDLRSTYDTQYAQVRAAESQDITELTQSYLSKIAENEKSLMESSEQLAALENEIYNFAGITDLDSLSTLADTEGGLGYYDFVDGAYTLTERGRDFFDRVLHTKYGDGENAQFFTQYLYENNPELYNFYMQNKGMVNELIGGLSKEDISYSEDDRLRVQASDVEKEFASKYADLYNKNKLFSTQQERSDYYNRRLDEEYTRERKEAYEKTTTRYDFDTLYDDIRVGPAFRWSYDGRESLNKNVEKDIKDISNIDAVATRTRIDSKDGNVEGYVTDTEISTKTLDSRQLSLINRILGKEGDTALTNNSGKITIKLYATKDDKKKKTYEKLAKNDYYISYEEFFKALGS